MVKVKSEIVNREKLDYINRMPCWPLMLRMVRHGNTMSEQKEVGSYQQRLLKKRPSRKKDGMVVKTGVYFSVQEGVDLGFRFGTGELVFFHDHADQLVELPVNLIEVIFGQVRPIFL
jgi:hypothetical protein